MDFEYDPIKSAANEVKHGISFDEAQALWDDPLRLEIPAREIDEPRFMIIGMIGDKYWSAVITYRQTNTRLISVRLSRAKEVALYDKSN
jgi:uncharacterized protein